MAVIIHFAIHFKLASEILPKISKNWVASNVLSNVVRIGVTDTLSKRNEDISLRSNLIPINRLIL